VRACLCVCVCVCVSLKTHEYCYIQVFWNVAPCCFVNTGGAEIPTFFQ